MDDAGCGVHYARINIGRVASFAGIRPVWPRHRRLAGDGTWDRVLAALLADADAAGLIDWEVSVDSTVTRAHQHGTNVARAEQVRGALANYKNLGEEPPDNAVGRSRGGLSTKIHHLCDGNGRPLVVLLGPGQGSDSRVFPHLLDALRVHRGGRGRPRTTPDAVMGDKAYSSRGHRDLLRRRGITAVIAEPDDQKANRKRRGAKGGRPPVFDTERYKNRNGRTQ